MYVMKWFPRGALHVSFHIFCGLFNEHHSPLAFFAFFRILRAIGPWSKLERHRPASFESAPADFGPPSRVRASIAKRAAKT
jgi:hypothetical protein